jgi:WD40 repeat protein
MSIPLWNANVPGPSSPLVSIVLRNRVRGSPKLARIGCCLANGLIGQGKAEALLLESSKTPSEQRMARERRGTATWDVLVAGEVSPSIGCGSLKQSRADASANGRRPSSSSRPGHVAPEVVQQRTDVLRRCLPGESERTGREHLCPTPLVEAHLGPGPPGVPRLVGNHDGEVNAVSFSPDGRLLLTAGADGRARIWRHKGSALTLQHAGAVTAATFGRGGDRVITASADGRARIWNTRTGALLVELPHGAALNAAVLSRDGRLAVTAGADGTAVLWDAVRARVLHRLSHNGPVNDARFSPNGKLVVTASDDHTAAIWRVSDGVRLATLSGHTDAVVAAMFSPDGRRVATASTDATARIWTVASGRAEHVLSGHSDSVTAIAFNPKGTRLATASSDRDARVWNMRTGNQVALLRVHAGPVNDVTFSADGRWIATAGPLAAGIWETRQGGRWPVLPVYLIRGPSRPINDVAFSPHGWRLAMGSRDGSVRTFDCLLCGGLKQLTRVARAQLHEIAHSKP